jgi:hypothetical protein
MKILEDVKALMEYGPASLQEKCFLKCFGEGTDMVYAEVSYVD